jgi:hypothetical protein
MACRKLEEPQVAEERARLLARPRYVPGDKGRAVVHFRFNLDPSAVGESLFAIVSNRWRTTLYRGAYQPSVTVEIDDKLSADKGYDHIEFWLLQFKEKQLCIWINERRSPSSFCQNQLSMRMAFRSVLMSPLNNTR